MVSKPARKLKITIFGHFTIDLPCRDKALGRWRTHHWVGRLAQRTGTPVALVIACWIESITRWSVAEREEQLLNVKYKGRGVRSFCLLLPWFPELYNSHSKIRVAHSLHGLRQSADSWNTSLPISDRTTLGYGQPRFTLFSDASHTDYTDLDFKYSQRHQEGNKRQFSNFACYTTTLSIFKLCVLHGAHQREESRFYKQC